MKQSLLASLLALGVTLSAGTFAAAPPREKSMDAPRPGRRLALPNMAEAALAPSSADVGDGDSFGRSVNFLGYAQTAGVILWTDCTDQPEGTCKLVDSTTSSGSIQRMGDEAVIRLPARAARSLLCFTVNPLGFAFFNNPSTDPQNARYTLYARWRIESDVLNDPTIIHTDTGAPFNGVIENGTMLGSEGFTLAPGFSRDISIVTPRVCNAGHLTRRGLIEMGLSESQAREVFRRPITLRFGATLNVNWGVAAAYPGIRVYGD